MDSIGQFIHQSTDVAIATLGEVIPIRSESADVTKRENCRAMAQWIEDYCKKHLPVIDSQLFENALSTDEDRLPPLVFATIGNGDVSSKSTILIYAHYDVQPALKSDGWDTEPWVMERVAVEKNGRMEDELRGRGTTDDKGPLIGWLHTLRTMVENNIDLPLNIKFVLEGMEESGSIGFDETIAKHVATEKSWWGGIDNCVVSDNYWLTTEKPCMSYGLRGLTSCQLEITGPAMDLHSGSFGGQVFQPMDDLIAILASLKSADETILIDGATSEVMEITDKENNLYSDINFSVEDKAKQIGVPKIRNGPEEESDPVVSKRKVLQSVWRNASLTIHGIEGAFSEPGFKTVIPRRVVGKFSIRMVPNQTAEHVQSCIRAHVEKEFAKRNSGNKMSMELHTGPWYYVDPESSVFEAGARAIEAVWGVSPDMTREGGSIPITNTLNDVTGKPVLLLPMGRPDDGAHSQNEKLDVGNFVGGMKVFARFLFEVSKK